MRASTDYVIRVVGVLRVREHNHNKNKYKQIKKRGEKKVVFRGKKSKKVLKERFGREKRKKRVLLVVVVKGNKKKEMSW